MITIRPVEKSDIDTILSVIRNNLDVDFPEYSHKTKNFILKTEFNLVEKISIPFFKILGAFDNNLAVGYLIGTDVIGGISDIHWLGVAKEFQRKGIGKKLVEQFINNSKSAGAHAIHLNCAKGDLPFYEKLGFETVGLIRKSYWGTDDYYMNKILREPKEENFLKL